MKIKWSNNRIFNYVLVFGLAIVFLVILTFFIGTNAEADTSFTPVKIVDTPVNSPSDVIAADIDGDNDLDVISAVYSEDSIVWYENTDGKGNFGPKLVINNTSNSATSVFAADIDGDLDLDVLATARSDHTVAWFENLDGLGTFGPKQVISSAITWAKDVQAGDIDKDGDMDVVVCGWGGGGTIEWFNNTNGDGSLWSPNIIDGAPGSAFRVALADIDNDTDLDLVSCSRSNNLIMWYENTDGNGTFGSAIPIGNPLAPQGVFAADIDGDMDLDVISANDDSVWWYENTDGSGTFGGSNIINNSVIFAARVFSADLDLDGDMDVLSSSIDDNTTAWYENLDGLGNFGEKRILSDTLWAADGIYSADIDDDGDMDVLSSYNESIVWFSNLLGKVHNLDKDIRYVDIQSGIDDADSGNRLMIHGEFTGGFVVDSKTINIVDSAFDVHGDIYIKNGGSLSVDPTWWNVTGNVYVDAASTLILDDTILQINSSFNGEFGIQVNSTGTMIIQNSSTVKAMASAQYWFTVMDAAIFNVEHSTIQDCGWNDTNPGLWIDADGAYIYESGLINNYNGVVFNSSSGSQIINCDILSNIYRAVMLIASDTTLTNVFIADADYGIACFQGSTPWIINSTIAFIFTNSFILFQDSHPTTLNTTFDKGQVLVADPLSDLTVKWFLHVYCYDKFGIPVPNAFVNLTDDLGADIPMGQTDAGGWIRWFQVTEYVQSQSFWDSYSPYRIIAEIPAYYGSEIAYMYQSRVVNVTVDLQKVHNIEKDLWYSGIQKAVDDADAGNHIEIYNGTHNETVIVDRAVTIMAVYPGNCTVDGKGAGNTFIIAVEGVEITGLNITNVGDWSGIYCVAGGFNIHDNEFFTTQYAINVDISFLNQGSVTVGDMYITDNEVVGGIGMGFYFYQIYFGTLLPGSDISVGQIVITGNELYTSGDYAIHINEYGIHNMNGGTVNLGNIIITDNIINETGWGGISFYGWLYNLTDVVATIGEYDMSGNNITTSSGMGINLDWWDIELLYGTTSVTVGNTYLKDNTIDSGDDGIYVLWDVVGNVMWDFASVTSGDIVIDFNNISSSSDGIYLSGDWGCANEMHNDSSFTVGNFVIDENTINATDKGIYLYMGASAYDMYDNTLAIFGDFLVTGNNITSGGEGINLLWDTVGYEMYDNASVMLGEAHVEHNDIVYNYIGGDYAIDAYPSDVGTFMHDNSSLIFSNWYIDDNNITSFGIGIYTSPQYCGYEMYDYSKVMYHDFNVRNNVVVASEVAIYIDYYNCGETMWDHSMVTGGNMSVTGNNASSQAWESFRLSYNFMGNFNHNYSYASFGWLDTSFNNFSSVSGNGGYISIFRLGSLMYGDSKAYIGDIMFTNNDIWSDTTDALYFESFYLNAWKMYNDSYVQIGNVLVNDNNLSAGGTGNGIELFQWTDNAFEMYYNASAVFGNFEFQGNQIEANGTGINFAELGFLGNYLTGTSIAVFGDFIVEGNTINATDDGINVNAYDWGETLSGSSSVTFGNFSVSNNIIESGSQGIFFQFEPAGYDIHDMSIFEMGSLKVSDNTIISGKDPASTDSYGILFRTRWVGYDMHNESQAIVGPILVNDNTVTVIFGTNANGIHINWISDYGASMHGTSTFTMNGNIEVCRNTVNTTNGDEGIFCDVYNLGNNLYGDNTASYGDFLFNDNTIIDANGVGIEALVNAMGYFIYDNSSVTIGNVEVNNNDILSSSGSYGIETWLYDLGSEMYGSSIFNMGYVQMNDNTITNSNGIGLYTEAYHLGYKMSGNSSATTGSFEYVHNNITSLGNGMNILMWSMARLMHNDTSFTMGDFAVNSNTINSTNNKGIYLFLSNSAYDMTGTASATFSDFLWTYNNITSGDDGISFYLQDVGYEMHDNASVKLGEGHVEHNSVFCTATSLDTGIEVVPQDIGKHMHGNSSLELGNWYVDDNNITSLGNGIYIGPGYWGYHMYDNSRVVFNDFYVRNNVVNASEEGIQIRYWDCGEAMWDYSTVTGGNMTVSGNNASSQNGYGYDVEYSYMGFEINNFSYASFGWFETSFNNFSSINSNGGFIRIQNLGSTMTGGSQAYIGDIIIVNNDFWSTNSDGLFFDYFYRNAYQMHDDSYVQIGNVLVNDNYLNAGGTGDGIELFQWQYIAYDLSHNASATFGNFEFQWNEIEANAFGIFGDDITEWGFLMYDNSSVVFGEFIFNGNTINATGDGIYINANHFGSNMAGNSTFRMGNWTINDNTIRAGGSGLYFISDYFSSENGEFSNVTIGSNEISGNTINCSGEYGIHAGWWNESANMISITAYVEIGGSYIMDNNVWMDNASGVGIECGFEKAGYQVYDDSQVHFGDYVVSNNVVYSEYNGMWIHFEWIGMFVGTSGSPDSHAIVDAGGLLINNNIINAPNYKGLTLDYELVGAYTDLNSSVTAGMVQIYNNTIDSYEEAMDVELAWAGDNIWGDGYVSLGRCEIDDNILNSMNSTGIYVRMFRCGYTMRENAEFYWEGIYLTNNDIVAQGVGIDFWLDDCVDLTGNSIVDFPGIWITGNMVDSALSAFNFTTITTPIELTPTAALTWGDVVIDNNLFDGELYGVALNWQDPNATIGQPFFYIHNCDIIGGLTNSTGFFLFNITDIYAENVTIDGFDNGIYTNNSIVHYMLNSTIVNCIGWDINLTSASYLFMINSTFINTSVFFEDTDSLLEVGWFMNVLVNSPLAFPIPEANVTVADVDGTEIFNGTVDLNGQVFYIICMDYQQNITGIIKNFNDYTANANKSGAFGSAIPNPTMNQTQLVIITLLDGIPPTIFSDNSDIAGTTGDPFYFEINASDNMGIANVYVNYTFVGYGSFTYQTMMGSGPYWRIITIPADFVGLMEYNFSAQDVGGNWINTTNKTVPITDNDEPIYIWDLQPITGTTGESVLVSIFGYDNIDITYYKIDIDGTLYDMAKDGDFYNFTINIPPDDLTSITYSIILNDSANNPNSTVPIVINVYDNDEPTYIWILQPTSGNTGDSVLVSIQATDNIGVTYYQIDVDGTLYDMIKDGDYYNFTINIPPDDLTTITYSIILNDSADNPNSTGPDMIFVLDDDQPSYGWILRPMAGMAGGTVNVSLIASDNIGITYYKINVDGILYDMLFDGNFYNFTINIPPGSSADITYNLTFNDSADNPITTPDTTIIVTLPDSEVPTYVWVLRPTDGTTGESVFVSLLAYDNTGITYYKIDIDGMLYDLVKEGDYYNFTLNIPLDSIASITYNVTFMDGANNPNTTADTIVTVWDNDEPTYIWILQPTSGVTGESMVVSISADDNIGITYYKIEIDGMLYDMVFDGNFYNYTIDIPPDSTASITYFVIFNDTADNPNSTTPDIITVTDIEEPSYTWVLQPITGTTGDPVLVSILGYDNVGITYFKINVSGILYDMVNDGDYYNFSFDIPPDDLASITYEIILNDTANNPNSTLPSVITVTDDDEPTFFWVLHPTTGITGESVIVSISADDNIGIIYAKIEIDGIFYDMNFDGNFFNYTIDIPSDSTASITYNITLNDSANNPLIIPDTVITVTGPDMEAPEYTWVSQPTTGTTGGSVLVSLFATDNVGITYYMISIYGVVQDLIKDGDYYNLTIDIPVDSTASITYYVTFNDSADNPNASGYINIIVTDDHIPTNLTDTSDTEATTGETFTFEVDASDNIGISAAHIIYWFGTDSPTNATMTGTGPFTLDITIPSDSLNTMHYYFAVSDAAGNWLVGGGRDITITDDNLPSISNDASDTSGEDGKEFRFQIDALDNIGVSQVRVAYWFGEDETQKEFLLLTETNGTYSGTITLEESGTMHYYFEVIDDAGNPLEGERKTVDITSKPKEEEEPNMLLFILPIIVIIVLILLFLLMRKKKEEEIPAEEVEGEEPGEEIEPEEGLEEGEVLEEGEAGEEFGGEEEIEGEWEEAEPEEEFEEGFEEMEPEEEAEFEEESTDDELRPDEESPKEESFFEEDEEVDFEEEPTEEIEGEPKEATEKNKESKSFADMLSEDMDE